MTANFEISFQSLEDAKGRIHVVFGEPQGVLAPYLKMLDARSSGTISKAVNITKFNGGKKAFLDLVAPAGLDIDRLLLFGLGHVAKYNEADWLALGGRLKAKLTGATFPAADVILEAAETTLISAHSAALVALGAMLRGYAFKKYKKKKKKEKDEDHEENDTLTSLRIFCHQPQEAAEAFKRLKAIGGGVNLARDLVNEPPNVLSPETFAGRISALSAIGLETEILPQERLSEIGMHGLLAVGQGSARPSFVAIMRWNGSPEPDTKPIVFVGKGVCFDSGGLSIKPAVGMEDMKGDMGGAAAVTGAMMALAERKAALNAIGIVGLTENMPSGTAQRPGDIVTMLSGQTVEVINTDAEGRMVLADIMWYAQDHFRPAAIITLATLTGAVIVSLGKEYAGLFANDDDLADQLTVAGRETGEKVWRLPLDSKYDKMINSKIADMKNLGGRNAGSITAAQFLQRFVMPDVPWAHLDIAGTAMGSPGTDINQSWGSGYGVMLLERLASKFYENA